MTTDWKTLCAEILKTLDDYEDGLRVDWDDWRARARAFLDQPEPEGLTDEELLQIAAATIEPYESCGIAIGEYEPENECAVEVYGSELIDFARAAFARARAATTTETP